MAGDDPVTPARLLAERLLSLRELRARRQRLAARQTGAERELAALDRARAAMLARLPEPPPAFAWGDLPLLAPTAAERVVCQRNLIRQFLAPEIAGWPRPLLEIISEPEGEPLADGAAATALPLDEALPEMLGKLPPAHYAVVLLPHIINLLPCPRALLFACRRVLRHGGRLAATLPGPAAPQVTDAEHDWRRYTPASAIRLLGDFFPAREMKICAAGSMADAVAAWYGLAEQQWSGAPAAELPLIIYAQARRL